MQKISFIIISIFTFSSLFFLVESTSAKSSGYRSSITGRYTTKGYTNSHISTTQSYRR